MGPTHRLRLAAFAAALVALGCSAGVDAPLQTSANLVQSNQVQGVPLDAATVEKEVGLVDLSPGRVTRVEGEERIRQIPAGGDPGAWEVTPIGFQLTMKDDATPVPGGPTYRVEDTVALNDPATVILTDLWRQDKSGLFNWQSDLPGSGFAALAQRLEQRTDDAHRAAIERALAVVEARRQAVLGASSLPTRRALGGGGGPTDHEITFLRYPLHPNASWDGRPGFNVWTCEAKEWLDTPAGRFHAGRMHIDVPGQLGPDDYALTWWAEPGEVKRHYHFLAPLTDANGNPIGNFEFEETLEVTQYTQPA